LLLAACGDNSTSPTTTTAPVETAATQVSPQQETERLNAWLDEQYEEQLGFTPQTRTVLGEKTDNDKLNDYSLEGVNRQMEWRRQSVATMRSDVDYDNLTEHDTGDP